MIALIDADIIMHRSAWKHEGDEDWLAVKETIDAMFEYIFFRTKSEKYLGFLTGKGNFRYGIAKTKEYKGNRKDRPKPMWLEDIRDYLIDTWGCLVTEGLEADDALGICQMNMSDDTIICSIDKDLLQIEGKHYNWNSDEIFLILEDEAEELFYRQVLQGDSTDNIQGIPRVGEVKAKRILDSREDKDYFEACAEAYSNFYSDDIKGLEMMNETVGLVKICKEVDDFRLKEPFKIPEPSPIF